MRAALRDASWYDHPDVTRPKRYHVVAEGPNPTGGLCVEALSVCGVVLCGVLDYANRQEFTGRDAAEVPVELRCRRRACAAAWPA